MKRTITGCCLFIIGALGSLALVRSAVDHLVSGWSTPPGRLLATISEQRIAIPLLLSCIFC